MTGRYQLMVLQIKCCLDSWEYGWFNKEQKFTAEVYKLVYNTVLELIEALKTDDYHWTKFCAARRSWAAEAK